MHWHRLTTLQWALLASGAVHAALLGVQLSDPSRIERALRDMPLDVILVNAHSSQAPARPQALAQANLDGGGEVERGRPTSPLPMATTEQAGDTVEEARKRIAKLLDEQQQLLTQVRREIAILPTREPQHEDGQPAQSDTDERRRQLLRLLAEIEKRVQEEGARPKKRYISPATREVSYAQYYDALRRRIEERGTRSFPQRDGKKLYGELTMAITLDARGHVVHAEVIQASATPTLDQRALAIVRAASPFGSFTPAMRAEADLIVVTSRFRFTREAGVEATMGSAER